MASLSLKAPASSFLAACRSMRRCAAPSAVWRRVVWCRVACRGMVWCGMAWFCAVWRGVAWCRVTQR
eukprot:3909776-Alexandrium_andersonii.AAC.1